MKNKNVIMIATSEVINDQRVMKEADFISSKGYNLEILCWDRAGKKRDKKEETINTFKIRRFFPEATYGTGLKQIVPFISYIREVKRYLKHKKIDIIHCQNLDSFIVGTFANRGSKLIFDMREYYKGRVSSRIKKIMISNLVNFSMKRADFILHVNETQIKDVKSEVLSKCIHLPNYPSEKLGEKKMKVKSKKLRISYIGAVRQYNEFINLFEAAKNIEGIEIIIHGIGVTYNKIKEVESSYQNVTVTGEYDPRESGLLYSGADIIYCVYDMNVINWKTAYPIKFYEAIITETPLIISKGSVLEEFNRKHDIAFAVDGSNKNEIESQLRLMIDDESLISNKISNLKKISNQFKWEDIVQNLNQIY